MNIETDNLLFEANSPENFLALIAGEEQFQLVSGYAAAQGLRTFIVGDEVSPVFIESLKAGEGPDPWTWGFLVIHKETEQAIGTIGFKGPPNADGMVEIAYGIVPDFENQGFATVAARTLVQFAQSDSRVKQIWAHTLPQPNASTRVLEKNDFHKLGAVQDPDDGEVWRWQFEN